MDFDWDIKLSKKIKSSKTLTMYSILYIKWKPIFYFLFLFEKWLMFFATLHIKVHINVG